MICHYFTFYDIKTQIKENKDYIKTHIHKIIIFILCNLCKLYPPPDYSMLSFYIILKNNYSLIVTESSPSISNKLTDIISCLEVGTFFPT